MGDDPDSTEPKPPRYLRTLIQGICLITVITPHPYQGEFSPNSPVLVSGDAIQQHTALKVAESLIVSHPPDLSEVCV